ncbi:MAG: nuclear transport factor 2 family protein [Phycisphaerae bacterium]
MNLFRTILFESPAWLGVGSFVLFATAVLGRRRWTGTARAYALPGVMVLTVILFVLQWAVVTDRERILAALDGFVAGIAAEQTPAWARFIDDGYEGGGLDRDAVVALIESALTSVNVYDTRLRRRDVTIDGDRADMVLGAVATVRVRGGAGAFHTGRWRIGWARAVEGWRIRSIRPEMIDTMAVGGLKELISFVP